MQNGLRIAFQGVLPLCVLVVFLLIFVVHIALVVFVVFATLFMVRVVHPEIGTQAFVRLNVTLVFCDGEQIFEKHLMDKK